MSQVYTPSTVSEVQAIVRAAAAAGRKLYPISTGRNWGYGDGRPVQPGCDIVDLGGMKQIRNRGRIALDHPVALIEPGVTQGQLHEFLQSHCPALSFNVTGSARATSIIGCSLDRGVGYLGPRSADLFGLEVVLANGELLYTGMRRFGDDSPLATCHPAGVGPQLDGLFFQGNFGIVTSACFRLVARPAVQGALSIPLPQQDRLPRLIDALLALQREGLLHSVPHIGNQARSHATLSPNVQRALMQHSGASAAQAAERAQRLLAQAMPQPWTALVPVAGSAAQVRMVRQEVVRRLAGIARPLWVTAGRMQQAAGLLRRLQAWRWAQDQAALIAAAAPLLQLALGEPSDNAVAGVLWPYLAPGAEPDGSVAEGVASAFANSRCGLIYISPALPPNGPAIERLMARMHGLAAQHGHTLYVTINLESSDTAVAVTNLVFDRSDAAATACARRCADALEAEVRAQGLELYRVGVDSMPAYLEAGPAPYWQALAALRSGWDPAGLISPGRYGRT